MGVLDRIKNIFSTEKKNVSLSDTESAKAFFGVSDVSSSGISVTTQNVFRASVALACVSIIANGIAQVPFRLYQKKGKYRLPAEDEPLYRLLEDGPNPYMSQFEFRETIGLHLALTGNAYIWKNKIGNRIQELFPIEPGRVSHIVDPTGDGWRRIFYVQLNDQHYAEFTEDDIWHIRWRGFNTTNFQGESPVKLARDAIGIAMATDTYLASSLREGIRPSGILSVKSNMNPEQQKEFRKSFQEQYAGSSNANKTMILSGDISYSAMGQSNEDAQLIENREFQVAEICRYWGVMPIMVFNYMKTTTYSSAEQLFLQHKVHTLDPWYKRIETSANKNLLTSKQRWDKGLYFKFIDDGLLRGDAKTRMEVTEKKIFNGIMTPNEARALDDMNPLEGGDKLYMQSAMLPLDAIAEAKLPQEIDETSAQNNENVNEDVSNQSEQNEQNTDSEEGNGEGTNTN